MPRYVLGGRQRNRVREARPGGGGQEPPLRWRRRNAPALLYRHVAKQAAQVLHGVDIEAQLVHVVLGKEGKADAAEARYDASRRLQVALRTREGGVRS